MLKQYALVILAVLGCAMLLLDQNTNRFGRTSRFVWTAEHRQAFEGSSRIREHSRGIVKSSRSRPFSRGIAELQARVRASVERLQAEECCWLNTLGKSLREKSSSQASPAWRDVQFDAQQLARILGFCKQEPV